jgi:hypothetical protein
VKGEDPTDIAWGVKQALEDARSLRMFELIVYLQWVSLIRGQFHLLRNQYASPVCFSGAVCSAFGIKTMNMKSVSHCTVLRILELKHLLKAQVLEDSADWA